MQQVQQCNADIDSRSNGVQYSEHPSFLHSAGAKYIMTHMHTWSEASYHDRDIVHGRGRDLLHGEACPIGGPVAADIRCKHLSTHPPHLSILSIDLDIGDDVSMTVCVTHITL